jgi:hypothetical protein
MKLPNKFSILILSYDGFSDIWCISFDYFFKYWQDCPYPIYLLTNYKTFEDNRVISLKVGEDLSWSSNVAKALEQIDSDYILTLFDDFILKSQIDNATIDKYISLCINNNYDYLRLQPVPPPDEKITAEIGRITEGSLYRLSLCTAIMKKETLKALLADNENAWAFEFKGSERSDKFYHFYSAYKRIIPYYNAIEQGKWRTEVLDIVKSSGIDVNKRGVHKDSWSERWKLIRKLKNKILFELVPPQFRRAFLNLYQRAVKAMSL